MDIIKQLNWRYAVKKFDANKKLSEAKLRVLKQAFNLTPTSFGLQTIKLVIVKNTSLREALVPHAYHQKQVLEASHLLVICIQDNIKKKDVNSYYKNIKETRDTPDRILEPYRKRLKKTMRDMSKKERLQWSKNQAYIALGNLLNVCALEQIDACPMEGFAAQEFDKILHLKEKGLQSVLLLPVGYRADDDVFSTFKKVRKPMEEVIIEL
ncbi:NAD(P)H-dependent oxidoreductase [Oceanihabitans sp. IOP_32]|uniref:NAD(P)H-dependent oxidoreductase n=1 Tax=Oceanihabitans sp. IOP_32 TaxID=2529032 RepID=UPI0012937914|nr:NAD(P)H-dependent oxidoreductase [Oceanihabitans sp. IOP_32]QFZ53316.1 NAD(P)H-dependent oxidoreductase [Oceanihabitans sp. IOP_32]